MEKKERQRQRGDKDKESVKKKKGLFREKRRVRQGQVGNNKKSERKYYFNKKVCIIDKLIWVFCKSDSVKQKKQVFCVKQTESFAQTNVIALTVAKGTNSPT